MGPSLIPFLTCSWKYKETQKLIYQISSQIIRQVKSSGKLNAHIVNQSDKNPWLKKGL
jgi:hypothetical protein